MQIYKASKILNMSNKELIQLIDKPDINHHMDNIPDDVLANLGLTTDTTEPVKEIPPEPKKEKPQESEKEIPPEKKQIELSCRCIGNKSPLWKWRHLIA